jgi:hypothetical protein
MCLVRAVHKLYSPLVINLHSEAMEVLNHLNHQFKEEVAYKSLILCISHADKGSEKQSGVSVITVGNIRRESKDRNTGSPLHTPGKRSTQKLK